MVRQLEKIMNLEDSYVSVIQKRKEECLRDISLIPEEDSDSGELYITIIMIVEDAIIREMSEISINDDEILKKIFRIAGRKASNKAHLIHKKQGVISQSQALELVEEYSKIYESITLIMLVGREHLRG